MKNKKQTKFDITNIESPEFLKNLSYKELGVLSKDISEYIVDITSIQGGHLSSNLGVVDSTIALCRVFDFTKDKIVFDVGHQCYAYKILTGRSLERLREKDGVSGFQKVSESSYDHFECGHSSTSISVANGFALARDYSKQKYDVVAYIGDSSIVNGLAMEGLNNASKDHKMIIVLNDNGMAISQPTGGLSKMFRRFSTSNFYRKSKHFYQKITHWCKPLYSFGYKTKNWFKRHLIKMGMFDSLGYSVIGPVDGHDIKAVEKALLRAKNQDKSCIVYLKTIKGKGYKFAEEDKTGIWHGVSSFDKETGEINGVKNFTWSLAVSDEVKNIMKDNDKIITVVPGTSLGSGLDSLFKEFPSRCLDVGIAEEHAATMSAGLAKEGYHPFISMYSTFSQRAYDEFSHDIARMNLNVTLLLDRSGLVGKDGNTHQGIFDESFIIDMPNTVVAMASRRCEINSLLKESLNNHGLFAIRYPRENLEKDDNDNASLSFGEWVLETSGTGTAIVSTGPATVELKKMILEKKINCSLLNAIYQKPILKKNIDVLMSYSKIIIYDSYATENGFAKSLCFELIKAGYKGNVIVKAIPLTFIEHATIREQKESFGLLPEQIIKLL